MEADFLGNRRRILAEESGDIRQGRAMVELIFDVFTVIERQMFMVTGSKFRHKDLLMPLSERNKDSVSKK